MYKWQLIDSSSSMHHINDPSLSICFHFDIYNSHQGQLSINQLLDINQSNHLHQWHMIQQSPKTIGINDNMIQQSPPWALMAIPTLMSTPISNCWFQHVDKACSTSIFNVTISPHQSLPINRHQSHQCDYLSPFDINGKGPFSSWGCSPYLSAFDLPLNNLSPF